MTEDMRIISTEEELKIFSDPYRLKIINVFQESDEPLTVKGCADIMGEVPAKVYYHVQKLLKINILVLDHVEVINGINAKYYKLTNKRFRVTFENTNQQDMFSQLNHVHGFLGQLLDDFKSDLINSTREAVENDIRVDSEIGLMSGSYIYLTEEEYQEVQDFLMKIGDDYGREKRGKKKYTFIGGIARKKE